MPQPPPPVKKKDAPAAAKKEGEPVRSVKQGALTLLILPQAEVFLNGRSLGKTRSRLVMARWKAIAVVTTLKAEPGMYRSWYALARSHTAVSHRPSGETHGTEAGNLTPNAEMYASMRSRTYATFCAT